MWSGGISAQFSPVGATLIDKIVRLEGNKGRVDSGDGQVWWSCQWEADRATYRRPCKHTTDVSKGNMSIGLIRRIDEILGTDAAWEKKIAIIGREIAQEADQTTTQGANLDREIRDEDGIKLGDPRHGKSGSEIESEVDEQGETFRAWDKEFGDQIVYGDGADEGKRRRIKRLVFAFRDMIAENPRAPPAIQGVEHIITMMKDWDGKPRRMRLRPHSPKEFQAVREAADTLLKGGVVHPSTSPWACGVVLVPKKGTDELQVCCDFRFLNLVTEGDGMLIPRIDDVLDKLRDATEMSALDMASGYWATNLREEDRAKTAFMTWSHGLLEWVRTRITMGLKNSGATYQRMLQHMYIRTIVMGVVHELP